MITSSNFTGWKGEWEGLKARFFINLHLYSQHWKKGSVLMYTVLPFSLDLQRGDRLMSFNVKGGYRHMFLHPSVRDLFLFRYADRCFQCIALPFGWMWSALCFSKMMSPSCVTSGKIFASLSLSLLISDGSSLAGRASTAAHFSISLRISGRVLPNLGSVRHPEKDC